MTLLGPILVLSLAAQTPNPDIQGSVVNSKGEPVAGATVLVYLEFVGHHEPALVSTRTNAHGQFRLAWPRPGGPGRGAGGERQQEQTLCPPAGYRPSQSAICLIGRTDSSYASRRLEHSHSTSRRQANGRCKGHAPSDPCLKWWSRRDSLSLASQFAATTGPDGKATLTSLAAFDEMMAVRVVGDSLAEQDIVLMERPGKAREPAP